MKRAFVLAGITAGMMLIAGYWNINRKVPPAVVEEVKMGEQMEFQEGIMISVNSYCFLSDEDQKQLYEKAGGEPVSESRILEVRLTIENTTAESKKIIMSDLYVEGIGMQNGVSKYIIDSSEERYSSLQQELQPGERKKICFPYNILPNQISKKEWETIEERRFWLVFSSYPIKKKLLLS